MRVKLGFVCAQGYTRASVRLIFSTPVGAIPGWGDHCVVKLMLPTLRIVRLPSDVTSCQRTRRIRTSGTRCATFGIGYVRQLLLILVALSPCPRLVLADDPVQFHSEVLPLLTDRCFRCHGPDAETREAGLRLDDPQSAFAELDSGATALVRGDLENSELVQRIESDDEDLRMPPPNSGVALTPSQRQLLKRWVAEGAQYQRHWAFVAPSRPPVPNHSDDWIRNEIDQFVTDRLKHEHLQPQPEEETYRLARRVALALTGLPPQWPDVQRLVQSRHPGAFAQYVDGLLGDSTYGERWARVWLDLARYADSAGYAQDPPRTIWKYRDWVIDAVNDNMPFDQFTIEQLAGDLLPNPTESKSGRYGVSS